MGGSYSVNNATETQSITNASIQSANNVCVNSCGANNKNITVDIVNTNGATINFDSTCSVLGSSCTVKNSLDTTIANTLSAVAKQTTVNVSNFLNFNKSDNNTTITQNIRNNVAQLISNTCKNIAENSNENIYIFIGNSKSVNIQFAQAPSVTNANCAYDNAAKVTLSNSASAKATQSVKNIGILGAIIIIIMLIIAVFVLFMFMGLLKGDGNKNKDNKGKEKGK